MIGWTVSGMTLTTGWIITNTILHSGRYGFITGSTTTAFMKQDITLVQGSNYLISLYADGYFCTSINVLMNNINIISKTNPYSGFKKFSSKFSSNIILNSLEIQGIAVAGGYCSVDDISINLLSAPTSQPSRQPSTQPSVQPSIQPSRQPSNQPTVQPSMQPK